MKNEFNHIDATAKKALKDFRKKSRKKAWRTLKHQLDARDAELLVVQNEQQKRSIVPIRSLLQKPWFKVAMAACFMLLIMFSYAIIKQWTNNKSQQDKNSIVQNQQTSPQENNSDTTNNEITPDQEISNEPVLVNNIDPANELFRNKQEIDIPVVTENINQQLEKQIIEESNSKKNEDPGTINKPALAKQSSGQPDYSISVTSDALKANDPVTTKSDLEPTEGQKTNEGFEKNKDKADISATGEDISDRDNQRIDSTDQQNSSTDYNSKKDFEIEIPNVITPNNDGYNDCFIIKNLNQFKINQLVIVDRNYKLIYEKSNYQNDWDARGITDGIYFYILVYKDSEFNNITRRGVLHIKRK